MAADKGCSKCFYSKQNPKADDQWYCRIKFDFFRGNDSCSCFIQKFKKENVVVQEQA